LSRTGRIPTVNWEPGSITTFAQVIQRARHHDEEALVTLYQRARPVIYRYVLARLGRPDLVEDVVADVFLVMVESIGGLRAEHEAGFFAWLIQIAQGKCSRALRHLARSTARSVPLASSSAWEPDSFAEPLATDLASDPVALQEWRETLEELGLALGSLSSEQQIVIVGRFLGGQSIEELALALGKQPGAIRTMQFRALGVLAERLGLARKSGTAKKGDRA
jgi:RNA polymerase sigma-70 factor, ECF subfamily